MSMTMTMTMRISWCCHCQYHCHVNQTPSLRKTDGKLMPAWPCHIILPMPPNTILSSALKLILSQSKARAGLNTSQLLNIYTNTRDTNIILCTKLPITHESMLFLQKPKNIGIVSHSKSFKTNVPIPYFFFGAVSFSIRPLTLAQLSLICFKLAAM